MSENPYRAPQLDPYADRGFFSWLRQRLGLPPTPASCSFCGIRWNHDFPLVQGWGQALICRRCVVVSKEVLDTEERNRFGLEWIVYRADGTARVVCCRSADGGYAFREEHLLLDERRAPFWSPALAPESSFDSPPAAMREATARVTWLSERAAFSLQ